MPQCQTRRFASPKKVVRKVKKPTCARGTFTDRTMERTGAAAAFAHLVRPSDGQAGGFHPAGVPGNGYTHTREAGLRYMPASPRPAVFALRDLEDLQADGAMPAQRSLAAVPLVPRRAQLEMESGSHVNGSANLPPARAIEASSSCSDVKLGLAKEHSKPRGEGLVDITVVSAQHLPKMDVLGSVDGFVRVALAGHTMQTHVKKNTFAPTWNETFTVQIPSVMDVGELKMEVFDWNMSQGDELVGTAALSSSQVSMPNNLSVDVNLAQNSVAPCARQRS